MTSDQWEAILRVRRAAALDEPARPVEEWTSFSGEWGRYFQEMAAGFDPGAREYLAFHVSSDGWSAGNMDFESAANIESQLAGGFPHLWQSRLLRIAKNHWAQYFLLDVLTGGVYAMPSLCVAPVFTRKVPATMSRGEVLQELNTAVDFVFETVEIFLLTVEDTKLNPEED
jgi:hypothetical protein